MQQYLFNLGQRVFSFQTDRFLTSWLVILALLALYGCLTTTRPKRLTKRWWIGGLLVLTALGLTVMLYSWKLPHGLSAQYYANPAWSDAPYVELDRYFETNGQRVDRFLDFNPNDFNDRYPFSGNPFSVKWEGYIYVPDDHSRLHVDSNFGAWLYIDDELISGQHQIDFGHPAAHPYLREGWSDDELWNGNPDLTFRWSSAQRSEFYLGVDELTDYHLFVRCRPFTYPASPPQEMSVFIDGALVETVMLQPEWKTYQMNIPASALENLAPGFFRVRFAFSQIVRPADVLAASTDGRQLAAAFDFAMLQKASSQVTGPQHLAPSFFSPGFHRIKLMARSEGKQPFLRLFWQHEATGKKQMVSEDVLFPKTFATSHAQQVRFKEQVLLGASVFSKLLAVFFLGWLIVSCLAPRVLLLFTLKEALWVAAIAIFAFVVRAIFILEMKTVDPNFYVLPDGTDHLTYLFFARGFLRGYWPLLAHEPFFQAPLISFYFIACSMLFGESLIMIRIVTAFFGTIGIIVVFLIARRLFNRPVAYLSAIFCACNGVLIFYDTSLLIAPLVIVLNLLTLWLMLQWRDRLVLSRTFVLGVLLGLTALARANIFLLMPFFLVWVLWRSPGTFLKKVTHYALVCVVLLLTLMPVTMRNYFASPSRQIVFTNTNGGLTFWIGNNASSNGMYSYSPALLEETRKHKRATGSSYAAEVLYYIKAQPLDYLQLEWTKFKFFWRGYEIGNNISYYLFRHQSRLLRFPWLNFVLIGPLGIVGMVLAITRWKHLFLLYSFVIVQVLTTLLFFALARYRLPVVPVLSMFAAYTLWTCFERLRHKKWKPVALIIFVFVVLYIALNYPEAARCYEINQGAPMPLSRLLRYWDLFYTW